MIAALIPLADEARAWWWGLVVGIVIGLVIANWDRLMVWGLRHFEPDPGPAWPHQSAGATTSSNLRLIWSAPPSRLYDFETEDGDVA